MSESTETIVYIERGHSLPPYSKVYWRFEKSCAEFKGKNLKNV